MGHSDEKLMVCQVPFFLLMWHVWLHQSLLCYKKVTEQVQGKNKGS